MMRNSKLQIRAGLKTILLSGFFSFLTGTGYSQTPPEEKLYMGQVPPASEPLLFPLEVKEGYFAAVLFV